jgi:hypothetical protein
MEMETFEKFGVHFIFYILIFKFRFPFDKNNYYEN